MIIFKRTCLQFLSDWYDATVDERLGHDDVVPFMPPKVRRPSLSLSATLGAEIISDERNSV
jgi:hypothetical protein